MQCDIFCDMNEWMNDFKKKFNFKVFIFIFSGIAVLHLMSSQCCLVFVTSIVSASWLSVMISSLASASKWHFNISPLRTKFLWDASIYWLALYYIFLSFSSMLLERFVFYKNKTLSLLDASQEPLNNTESKFTIFTFLIHFPWSYCAQCISACYSKEK